MGERFGFGGGNNKKQLGLICNFVYFCMRKHSIRSWRKTLVLRQPINNRHVSSLVVPSFTSDILLSCAPNNPKNGSLYFINPENKDKNKKNRKRKTWEERTCVKGFLMGNLRLLTPFGSLSLYCTVLGETLADEYGYGCLLKL